jgi:hypothetical protein
MPVRRPGTEEPSRIQPKATLNHGQQANVRRQADWRSDDGEEEGELRFIPTRTHGVIDYLLMGALLIVAPYLLGFADGTAARWVPQIVGAGLIGASLLTDYELGVVRMIPMPVHLGLDVAAGLLLAASP